MKTVLKLRWAIIALWLAATVVLMVSAPGMEGLVREKGQIDVPDGYSSKVAGQLLAEFDADNGGAGESTVLVWHRESGLTDADYAEMKAAVAKLADEGEEVGITSVTSHFSSEELKDQLVAKDGKTALTLIGVDFGERSQAEQRDALYEVLSGVKVDHYYTGNWIIQEDVIQSSQEGLQKTEYITVGFILVILFVVFRSAVAPIVPLLAVGFSYLVSQSVVAYLVEYVDFPLSTFTQIFMVAVMFGIGTDYCILLISRFKEELAHHGDKTEAILTTYRTAGRTVLFSALAVLVGFASIGFSTFVLYRSAVAVAVGVAVLLIALYTIVPFFMAVLGTKLFWPARGSLEHKQSRLWGAVGSFSLRKPLWALVVLAVLIVPFLVGYKGATSFNSLDEIGDKYASVRGFNLISESFGPGDSLPSTIVVKAGEPLDTPEGLAVLERVSRELANVEGVKAVRSATRPTGEPLEELQVTDQVGQLEDGLGKSGDGLGEIGSGLSEASESLRENAPKLDKAVAGAGELVRGTEGLKAGVVQLGEGLRKLQRGLADGSVGAKELAAGVEQARASAVQLAAASKQLLGSYQGAEAGLGQLADAYDAVASRQEELGAGLGELSGVLDKLGAANPELQDDPDYKAAVSQAGKLEQEAAGLSEQLGGLNSQLAGVRGGLAQANAGYAKAAGGQEQLSVGLGRLAAGLAELQKGVAAAAAGQGQIVSKLPELTGGIDQIAGGQRELQSGFAELNGQLGALTDGLDKSVDGLTQVTDGLGSAEGYLNELAGSPDKQLTGWFIPKEAIASEGFQQGLGVYLSEDRKMAKFDVVFTGNPYEEETMKKIPDLEAAVARGLAGGSFEGAKVAVGGVTSINHDLGSISAEDYSRTVLLMLVGIFIILVVMFRSIVMPLYLILSLWLTFYTSMAIAEVIFVRWLGYTGISWSVPFFGFVLLVALGIDYSIFLMDRFKEYRHLSPQEAILEAMRNMGTVIMSAAVILGGTFAAMLPSGVMSLLQIATIVLCGLFLYALVMLPLFIPVMVRMFGPANWWPFMGRGDGAERLGAGGVGAGGAGTGAGAGAAGVAGGLRAQTSSVRKDSGV
ncbi:efflux RND transporter permease subunit [Paenibacillus sp. GCM10023252]|uniref:efflux RND transporter permease subunit n=1 Tax=Paenibacillus sp. GCM10023252 TaxID=3252649 RepID=UPI003609A948